MCVSECVWESESETKKLHWVLVQYLFVLYFMHFHHNAIFFIKFTISFSSQTAQWCNAATPMGRAFKHPAFSPKKCNNGPYGQTLKNVASADQVMTLWRSTFSSWFLLLLFSPLCHTIIPRVWGVLPINSPLVNHQSYDIFWTFSHWLKA